MRHFISNGIRPPPVGRHPLHDQWFFVNFFFRRMGRTFLAQAGDVRRRREFARISMSELLTPHRPQTDIARPHARIDSLDGVRAVAVLAELISRCAALRADGSDGDGAAWVDAARALGGTPDDAAIARALAKHSARVASG
jgi:hypothetical protein